MGFINKYPYVDFHELNADALIAKVDDASAEAKAAAETVATYDDRLTTVENDLAPIKSAMPGIASDISDLQHDTGIIDSLITNTINPAIDTLQNEVESPTTGLLDRVTALENQPATQSNAVYYLEFDSSLVTIDPSNAYDSRIDYDWLKQFVPLNTSGEDTHVIKLYDSHTQKVYDLVAFHLQESASPDGAFAFTCRSPHTTGGVIDYYTNSTVTVLQNGTNPTFDESDEFVLPEVSVADAGSFLAVDENGEWGLDVPGTSSTPITITAASNITIISNKSKRVGDTIILDFSFSTDALINANDFIVTTQFIAPGNAAPNYFVAQSNVPVSQRMLLNINGYLSSAESIAQGVTIVINYRYEV